MPIRRPAAVGRIAHELVGAELRLAISTYWLEDRD
jgi:hypothetical protein